MRILSCSNPCLMCLAAALIVPTFVAVLLGRVCFASNLNIVLDSGLKVRTSGAAGNSYQLESSFNLTNWTTNGPFFTLAGVPYERTISATNGHEFFRVKGLASAQNLTYLTSCAENDNVMVFLRGEKSGYSVRATHPTYTVTDYTLTDDITGCTNNHQYENHPFDKRGVMISDGGFTNDTVWAYRDTNFWRPSGMTVSVNGNNATKEVNMQQMVLHRYIPNSSPWEFPSYLVLYCDGNLRLIPFPPSGHKEVSYGSSVIIGPTEIVFSLDGQEPRPVCEIASVDYRTTEKRADITYKNGGTAQLDIRSVTRSEAVVNITINYPADRPFCTLRSNFVSDQKCDTGTVVWTDLQGVVHTNPIASFAGTVGSNWFFTRLTPSVTRNSAPDIRITPY